MASWRRRTGLSGADRRSPSIIIFIIITTRKTSVFIRSAFDFLEEHFILKKTTTRRELASLFHGPTTRDVRKGDTTTLSGVEQLVNKFVDMDDGEARVSELPKLPVVIVKRLEIAVDVLGRANESHVKSTQHSDISIVFVPDEL